MYYNGRLDSSSTSTSSGSSDLRVSYKDISIVLNPSDHTYAGFLPTVLISFKFSKNN